MCFSAEASFAAGSLLLPAGVYCVWTAARKRPAYVPIAACPLIFGVQQFAEGLVWVGLGRGDETLVLHAALAFLFVAVAFWPFWVPLSVAFLERRRGLRVALVAVAVLGLAFGCVLWVPAAFRPGGWLEVSIQHHSIRYRFSDRPLFEVIPRSAWHATYLAIVAFPFLVSPDRRFTLFSVLLAVGTVVSHTVFWYAFLSVWCFFAAILSLQLCLFLRHLEGPASGEGPGV